MPAICYIITSGHYVQKWKKKNVAYSHYKSQKIFCILLVLFKKFRFKRRIFQSMKLIITEKPSVAGSIAKVLGADTNKGGYMEGNGYVVSHRRKGKGT